MNITLEFVRKKTGIIFLNNYKTVRKFIVDSNLTSLIKNEYDGLNWYGKINSDLSKYNKLIKFYYNYVDMPLFKGYQKKFWHKLSDNYLECEKVVSHYKNVWPKNFFVPAHGDLTLSNVIFRKQSSPIIIDWENFTKKTYFWGYDLSYFLISTIALPSIFSKENKIDLHELLNFEKLWNKAFEKKFEQKKIINFFKKQFGTIFKFRKLKNYYPNLLNSYKIKQIEEIIYN